MILVGMTKVQSIPPLMLKPKFLPPLEAYPEVGIEIDDNGVGILGISMKGKANTTDISQRETYEETCIDGVGLLALKDGKGDITGIPPIALIDGMDGSTILETLRTDII